MASNKEKNGGGESKIDSNAWMTTFADLIMLLLTFFVLLLTMKSMDAGKIREIFVRTHGPLDFVSQDEHLQPLDEFQHFIKAVVITSTDMLEEAIDMMQGVEPLGHEPRPVMNLRELVDISEDERGVIITLESDQLFESGEVEVRPDKLPVLDTIGRIFKYAANDILIMGHTDNIPVRDRRFVSNLDLSVYRALNVLYYLVDCAGLRPGKLAVGGFGDQRPIYPNNIDKNRAKNRRVEFILRKPA